jgi:glutathione S-transferase
VPTLVLDDGRSSRAESGAILFDFADGTGYLPQDAFERAQVLQWPVFEKNEGLRSAHDFIASNAGSESPRRPRG